MRVISGVLYVLLAPILGGFLNGLDRVISSRMQNRKGPPLFQSYYDVLKLFTKETFVVNKIQDFFAFGFFIFIVFTGILFFAGGDLLLIFFSLTLASIFLILCASSTSSPYSAMGAQRELIQMMSYEPMVLIVAIGFYMATKSFNVYDIIQNDMPAIVYLPGIFLGFVFILIIKLRKSPFDLSTSHHAHQEMVKGLTTEFSGKMLALIEITHWYENVMLFGIVGMFFITSAWWSWLVAFGAISLVFIFEILIDNSDARVRWQTMLKSSWVVALILGFLNLIILKFIG
ncbi:MAG: complex I subunit 1 family protein [Oscillospiraceae bacterium]